MWTIRQQPLDQIESDRQQTFLERVGPYLRQQWPGLSAAPNEVLFKAVTNCMQYGISDELDVVRLVPILLSSPSFLVREDVRGILKDESISATDRVDLLQEILMFGEEALR